MKIIINIGVIVLTIYDMFRNIRTIMWGVLIAVAMAAIFEIVSNVLMLLKKQSERFIWKEIEFE